MRVRGWFIVLGITAAALFIPASVSIGQAQDGTTLSPIDERCLSCHAGSDAVTTFGNGDEKAVNVDYDTFNQSAHGLHNPDLPVQLSCYDCHGDYTYPHNGEWESARDFRIDLNQQCEKCHSHQSDLQADSTHAEAFEAGNENAAVCVDCHGYHDAQSFESGRANISLTCGECHVAIFDQYQDSVHGAALLDESNPDVPTCINCHGVHNIENPTTALFRLKSPEICAKCHADDELMEKYDISTHVFETYVADFHGTTVTIFRNQAPDAEVNKAVCYDCHGVHDIRSPDDPESSVIGENLTKTCQQCHPDATADFATSWMGHYEPAPEKYALVYYVNQFYKFLIPGVLGFMGLIIATDIFHRLRKQVFGGEDNHH